MTVPAVSRMVILGGAAVCEPVWGCVGADAELWQTVNGVLEFMMRVCMACRTSVGRTRERSETVKTGEMRNFGCGLGAHSSSAPYKDVEML